MSTTSKPSNLRNSDAMMMVRRRRMQLPVTIIISAKITVI